MRVYTFLLLVVLTGSVIGVSSAQDMWTVIDDPGLISPNPGGAVGGVEGLILGAPDDDPIDFDLLGWLADPVASGPSLPGFEFIQAPWTDVSGTEDGITKLSINPAHPDSSDEVSVTISGYRPQSDLEVERTTLRIEGNQIWLDLYWYTRPPMPVVQPPATPEPPATAQPPATPQPPAIGQMSSFVATQGLCLGGAMAVDSLYAGPAQSVTLTQYDIDPYYGIPFAYTQVLGTFSPGMYVLHVVSHSPLSDEASESFMVSPAVDVGGGQSWWSALLGNH